MVSTAELVDQTANTLGQSADQLQELDRVFAAQQAAFQTSPYPSAAERVEHIKRVKPMLLKNLDKIVEALNADFGNRAKSETLLMEIKTSLDGIRYYAKNTRKWMKPSRRHSGLSYMEGKSKVLYQPLGVVGIISPWNYPIYLSVGPLLCALSAGNRAIIKMSEATPRTAEVFKEIVAEYFDEDHVTVITGEADVGIAFSQKPFDHILFTGSTSVGYHIMRAAAENLTPVTLELGGKSPAIIHPDFPMKVAAERIAFGKCFNAGQTCVAPDYVFCHESQIDSFVETFTAQVTKMFPTCRDNPDFTSIINDRQLSRLKGYLDDAQQKGAKVIEINPANEDFEGSGKLPFTLVLNVTDDMQIAQDEIFGPLFIVRSYQDIKQAISYINNNPRPLALYYFDYNKARADHMITNTHSGGVCINDSITQVGVDDLPFGGVGASGMGQYHGHEGFLTFSKAKGIYTKGRLNFAKLGMAPYNTKTKQLLIKGLLKQP